MRICYVTSITAVRYPVLSIFNILFHNHMTSSFLSMIWQNKYIRYQFKNYSNKFKFLNIMYIIEYALDRQINNQSLSQLYIQRQKQHKYQSNEQIETPACNTDRLINRNICMATAISYLPTSNFFISFQNTSDLSFFFS